MSRRTHAQVRVETMIAERGGIIAMVAKHRDSVGIAVRGGKLSAAEGEHVMRQVAAFAESCAIGLHVEG